MDKTDRSLLIVGLGNPGASYAATRHNIGHAIVRAFGKDLGWKFKSNPALKGEVAEGEKDGKTIYLLLPTTYMNHSGMAVEKCVERFKIVPGHILVVVDDIYVDFGRLRLRESGSPGGHNGLKSIEMFIGTDTYYRLKIGVGDHFIGELADYVLSNFREDELTQISGIIKKAHVVMDYWIKGDVQKAKEFASDASLNN